MEYGGFGVSVWISETLAYESVWNTETLWSKCMEYGGFGVSVWTSGTLAYVTVWNTETRWCKRIWNTETRWCKRIEYGDSLKRKSLFRELVT